MVRSQFGADLFGIWLRNGGRRLEQDAQAEKASMRAGTSVGRSWLLSSHKSQFRFQECGGEAVEPMIA